MQKKLPVYIGVFVENQKEAYIALEQYVKDGLKQIYQTHKEEQIINDIENFEKIFMRTKDAPHITTLFFGKSTVQKLPQKQKEIYNQFKEMEGEKVDINLEGILYIPGYLICAITFPTVKCSNEYPHVTLFLHKTAKAVQSNDVCQFAFNDNQQIYKNRNFSLNNFKSQTAPAKFKNIHFVGKQLTLPGIYRAV